MQWARCVSVLMLSGFFISCASEQTITKTQVKKDPWGNEERFSVGKDESGNPMMKSDRRSSLEGKSSDLGGNRDFNGQDYTTKSYRKKRWGGNREFGNKKYEGNTDASRYKSEPWFVKKQANAGGKKAYANGSNYRVDTFGTSNARERSQQALGRPADAETAVRRRVFVEPGIKHWKDQGQLSVGDTNRRLGR